MLGIDLKISSPEKNIIEHMHSAHLTIGRGEQANIIIDDAGLSKIHASIHQEQDRLWILDENSTNGTLVNNRVVPAQGKELFNGDIIKLGSNTAIEIILKKSQPASLPVEKSRIKIPIPLDEKQTPLSIRSPSKRSSTPTQLNVLLIAGLMIGTLIFLATITLLFINNRKGIDRSTNNEKVVNIRPTSSPTLTPTPEVSATPLIVDNSSTDNIYNGEQSLPDRVSKKYWEMNDSEKYEFIEQRAQHISMMMGNRPYAFTDDVLQYIKRYLDGYASRAKSKSTNLWGENLNSLYSRASRYAPDIIAAFNARGIPPVVGLYIVMIETEYHECLESPVGAKGLFQFMPDTARAYGVDPDDRCDVKKMSPAAAHYMADRITEFGSDSMSVALGIAGYNRSPDSVRRDLHDVLNSENRERSFWSLITNSTKLDRAFQNENIKYVPKFFAAAIVGETPWAFGLNLKPISTYTSTSSGTATNNIKFNNPELEKAAVEVMRRISNDDQPYIFSDRVLQELNATLEVCKTQPQLANALTILKRDSEALATIARREGVEPGLLFYMLLADSEGGTHSMTLTENAHRILPQLADLRATFGTTLADGSLIVVAAYRIGGGSKRSHPLLAVMRRVIKNPQTERNIWFLHERGELKDEVYQFVLKFLAYGILAQNTTQYGINAPTLVY